MEIEQILKEGEGHSAAGNWEAARECFQRIAQSHPDHIETLNNLGVVHYAEGDLKGAESCFLKALAIKDDYLDALLNLVDVYQGEKRWDDAACQLERCLLIRGDNSGLYNRLAMICMESGNFEKARSALVTSLDLEPEQKKIREVLATIKDTLSSKNTARSPAVGSAEGSNGDLNILIRGGGFVNKGAEAMVKTVQCEMAGRLPHAKFFMEVPQQMEAFIESRGLTPVIANSRARYTKLDGVIDVSGFALGDTWGIEGSRYYRYHNSIFESFGKPVVFLPQAWGPFTNQSIRQLSAAAINLSDCAYARDKRSYQYMSELEGVNRQKIGLAPDIAYQFKGASAATAMGVLKESGLISTGKNMVGIMPNMQVYVRTEGKGTENKYVKLLIELVKYFLEKHNFSIVLIPHQVQPVKNPEMPDDRFLCDLITVSLGNVPDVIALREYYSAEILKAVIGKMDLIIGSRYHGIIAALSQMIPTLVLGWSHKYFELLCDVGIEQYIADYKNLNKEDLLGLAESVWLNREELRRTLEQKVPEQVSKSAGALDHAASVFTDRYPS